MNLMCTSSQHESQTNSSTSGPAVGTIQPHDSCGNGGLNDSTPCASSPPPSLPVTDNTVPNSFSVDDPEEQQPETKNAIPIVDSGVSMSFHPGLDAVLTCAETLLLQQLVKQLAYYFAPANMNQDTYLQTLQRLNDGCVPARILANFGKVKAILWATPSLTRRYLEEDSRADMIVRSVREYGSSFLQVEQIDASTGKIVETHTLNPTDGDEKKETDGTTDCMSLIRSRVTIWAIRCVGDCTELARSDLVTSSLMDKDSAEINTNAILLRDVNPVVTEEDIHALFMNDIPDCPQVINIQRDVYNCWFVTLNTDSRDIMLRTVMHLRGLTLAGDYIQARLKNSTVHHAPLIDPLVLVAAQISESGLPLIDEAAPYKRSKKRRMRGKKKKKSSANHSKPGATVQNGPVDNKATQQTQSNKGKKRVPNQGKKRQTPLAKSSETITCKPAPPTMNHEEFPTLEDKTVEWATEPEYMVMKASKQSNAPTSDAASTATTTSSSADSGPKRPTILLGYAAAARKPPCAEPMGRPKTHTSSLSRSGSFISEQDDLAPDRSSKSQGKKVQSDAVSSAWCRSFADTVRVSF